MKGIAAPEEERVTSRIAASFRDPSGYVFLKDETVYRAVDAASFNILKELHASGLLPALMAQGRVVSTEFLEDKPLSFSSEHPGYSEFLRHEKISPITYPYEWSFSMLADAAILTLELQMELAQAGFALKDASAFNIQFVRGRPVFIDLTSIEKPDRQDLWFALGQFQRMFLFPLLLMAHRGWDLRSYFLPRLDGRTVQEVATALGSKRWRPAFWLDVTLPALLEKKAQNRQNKPVASSAERTGNVEAQLFTLKRLRNKIRTLAEGRKVGSLWANYTQTCTYDQAAEHSKKESLRSFLMQSRPTRVLDLGCNTGDYSFLAAESGAVVSAVDGDHDAVEMLYRRLKNGGKSITPMVQDLGNPTPGIGYMNRERTGFLERTQSDCILALALIHHLVVSGNHSFDQVRDLFATLTTRDVVLEFVPRDDPMFQKLIQYRKDIYAGYSLENCVTCFSKEFQLLDKQAVKNSPRTLLFFRKRG